MEARILNLEGSALRMSQGIGKLESDVAHIQRDLGEFKTGMKVDLGKMKVDLGKMGERMDRDFRLLFGAIITVAIGLGSLMAKGFGWL